ncbi:MAG: ComF family protein [Bacteroidales bacterium]|nr:ComF family protein [Bacteroidales bacterium]MCF8456072.1 ComF family protein [Bacteroidales bacterium]
MTILAQITYLLYDLIHLVYPKVCVACGENLLDHEDHLCTHCLYDLPKTNYHQVDDNPVAKLFWGRVSIFKACSFFFFNKGSKFQTLIHKLKYDNRKEIGYELGKHFGCDLLSSEDFKSVDVIMPVPLHASKEKIRGYNQSDWIARGISASMDTPVDNNNLIRLMASETQTKKSRFERWENVDSIFQVTNPEALENKHVLLVDDVVTTGSTLEACAQELLKIPNVKVSIATLAVA